MTLAAPGWLQLWDSAVVLFGLAVPVYCVARWNLRGAVLGALALWVMFVVEGHVLSAFDPERQGAFVDFVWLCFGLFASSAYALLIFGLKLLWSALRKRLTGR